ncbi:MAG: phosphotransferase enzyme family protein [Candidatus Cryptobacteroides sp.]
MIDTDKLTAIAESFEIEGTAIEVKPLGEGFINDTLSVTSITPEGKRTRYILQRKNRNIFPDIPAMMHNTDLVTSHLKKKIAAEGGDPARETLTLIKRRKESLSEQESQMPYSDLYLVDGNGDYWTMCLFIEGSVTFDRADTPLLAYKGGQGIGKFQSLLSDFDTPLAETIKGFHDMRFRFGQWDSSIRADKAGRVKELGEEIGWIESRREEMMKFRRLVESGEIPVRVAHNDTKLSNILFDSKGEVLCVIDLDTCMSASSLYDFGDAIRSYANTGAEDDRDLSAVSMSMELFRAYTAGYLSMRKNTLLKSETDNLAFAARYITFEQVLRFLMDYIDGDIYYKISYPEHNLVRTRAQYKLLHSMEEQYDKMCATVRSLL